MKASHAQWYEIYGENLPSRWNTKQWRIKLKLLFTIRLEVALFLNNIVTKLHQKH